MISHMNVLLIDDEEKITKVVASYFEQNGDTTYVAHTGETAIQMIDRYPLDMIVLDLMLPDMDGESICQYVKQNYEIPIIMLTAKVSIESKIKGFNLGADDYVVKPFHPKEILLRAERLLPDSLKKSVLHFGSILFHKNERKVSYHGEDIQFTKHEFDILLVLAEHPKKVFTRDELIQKLFHDHLEIHPRVIDQHIKNIRKKLHKDVIQTVFGLGYKMNEKDLKQ